MPAARGVRTGHDCRILKNFFLTGWVRIAILIYVSIFIVRKTGINEPSGLEEPIFQVNFIIKNYCHACYCSLTRPKAGLFQYRYLSFKIQYDSFPANGISQ